MQSGVEYGLQRMSVHVYRQRIELHRFGAELFSDLCCAESDAPLSGPALTPGDAINPKPNNAEPIAWAIGPSPSCSALSMRFISLRISFMLIFIELIYVAVRVQQVAVILGFAVNIQFAGYL